MNFRGQNMLQGQLCWLSWLTGWKVMEIRGARKEIYPSKDEAEVGKKKDCGGLSMAEHQVPPKPLFLSFLGVFFLVRSSTSRGNEVLVSAWSQIPPYSEL